MNRAQRRRDAKLIARKASNYGMAKESQVKIFTAEDLTNMLFLLRFDRPVDNLRLTAYGARSLAAELNEWADKCATAVGVVEKTTNEEVKS